MTVELYIYEFGRQALWILAIGVLLIAISLIIRSVGELIETIAKNRAEKDKDKKNEDKQ